MAEARREKILPGFRVGRLTVTEATDQRKSGYKVWNCTCDCGGSIRLDTRALQRGTIRDCGCVTKVPPGAMDLTGRQFGRLTAVSPTKQRRYGGIVWRCECDCGNVSYVSSHQLLSGNTKSCGCMQNPPLKDFIGKRFGQLTVTDYAGKKPECTAGAASATAAGRRWWARRPSSPAGPKAAAACKRKLFWITSSWWTALRHPAGSHAGPDHPLQYQRLHRGLPGPAQRQMDGPDHLPPQDLHLGPV